LTSSPSPDLRGRRFLTLDGLRGIAAVAVMIWHTGATRYTPGSYLAVDLFFGLSGFVLAHAYGERDISFVRFAKGRLIRLYPLYLLSLVVAVGLYLVSAKRIDLPHGLNILSNLFMAPSVMPVGGHYWPYSFNIPTWSLLFELGINAVWFVLRPALSDRVMIVLLVIGAILMVGLSILAGGLDVGSSGTWFLVQGSIRVFYSFFAGLMAYRLWRRATIKLRAPPLLCLIALLVVFALPLPRMIMDPLAVVILFPVLIFVAAEVEPRSWSKPVFVQLGLASYAIYTIHGSVIWLVTFITGSPLQPRPWLVAMMPDSALGHLNYLVAAMTVCLGVPVALALDYAFDGPVRAWLTRRLLPRPRPAAQ
jgi:peptidoglycan/LPS O-acetylase OafA/YrhL